MSCVCSRSEDVSSGDTALWRSLCSKLRRPAWNFYCLIHWCNAKMMSSTVMPVSSCGNFVLERRKRRILMQMQAHRSMSVSCQCWCCERMIYTFILHLFEEFFLAQSPCIAAFLPRVSTFRYSCNL